MRVLFLVFAVFPIATAVSAEDAWLVAVRYDQREDAIYLDTTGSTPPEVNIAGGVGISLELENLRVRPSPYTLAPADGVVETITADEEKTRRGWRVTLKVVTTRDFPYEVVTLTLGDNASQVNIQLKDVNLPRTKPETSGKVAALARPDAGAPVSALVEYYTRVAVIGRNGGYYLVRTPDDRTGWVPEINVRLEGDTSYEPAAAGESGPRAAVIASGKKHVGKPYVWGGTGPDGFDCSGLMDTIFAENGVDVPRGAKDQFDEGRKVKRQDLRAGDLVFFSTYAEGVSHVGVWLGAGKFLHAESSDAGVTITPISIPYWDERYYGAATYFDD